MIAWLRRLHARVKYRHFERDLAEELEVHQAAVRDVSVPDADDSERQRIAAIAFGNRTLALEDARMIWIPRALWQWKTDATWAWRGLRARRWRAPFMVALLGGALAANTLLFAAADALLFRPVPFRQADRLVTFLLVQPESAASRPLVLTPHLLDELRGRTHVFAQVHGRISGYYTFIMDEASPQREPTTFVTPGLIEMLGVAPAAGRGLQVDDARRVDMRTAVVAASLAVERFGSVSGAVGQILQTSEDPLQIVGVMPRSFQYPDAAARIWRPLDYRQVKEGPFYGIALLAPGVSAAAVPDALSGLATSLAAVQRPPGPQTEVPRIAAETVIPSAASSSPLVLTLLGASLCLLLIVCANLASLEIASMAQRARMSSIQLALGATPSRLKRAVLLETGGLTCAAFVLAAGCVWLGHEAVATWLPSRLTRWSLNPVDLDLRAWLFLLAAGAVGWLAMSVPAIMQVRGRDLARTLKDAAPQILTSRRIARVRGVLTAAEIGLALVLIVGSVLYARTYAALLGVDKGFESRHIVGIDLTMPTALYSAPGSTTVLLNRVLETLRARHDVVAVTRVRGSVFDPGTTIRTRLQIDGQPAAPSPVTLAIRTADPTFFETFGLRPVRGRLIEAGEAPTNIMITPQFAEAVWPGADPIGRTIRTADDQPPLTVIGVVRHIRYAGELPGDRYGEFFELYVPPVPPVPASTPAGATSLTHITESTGTTTKPPRANVPRSGAMFMFLSFAARLQVNANLADIERDLRAIDSRFALRVQPVDALYAETYRDRLLAVRAIGMFAGISCAAAVSGLFAVMTFLVASRRREIGIRLALGATRGRIRAHFLRSAFWLVVAGTGAGLALAIGLAHGLRSQFYGVAPADPLTYVIATLLVIVAGLLAAWLPARAAASVDPALTLRQE